MYLQVVNVTFKRAYGRTPHQSMACLSDSGMYDACSLPYIASMGRIPRCSSSSFFIDQAQQVETFSLFFPFIFSFRQSAECNNSLVDGCVVLVHVRLARNP